MNEVIILNPQQLIVSKGGCPIGKQLIAKQIPQMVDAVLWDSPVIAAFCELLRRNRIAASQRSHVGAIATQLLADGRHLRVEAVEMDRSDRH